MSRLPDRRGICCEQVVAQLWFRGAEASVPGQKFAIFRMISVNCFPLLKYIAVFLFVVWVWETRNQSQESLYFWSIWAFAFLYGGYSFAKIRVIKK